MTLWGLAAVGALTAATYAGSTPIGRERVKVAVAEMRELVLPTGVQIARPLTAQEGRRLAENVRTLAADRERLLARIATLEHNVEGITGSIARVQRAAEEARHPADPPPSAPEMQATPPQTKAPENVTAAIEPVPPVSVPAPAPAQSVTKQEFGLDMGNAGSVEALRTAWTIALRKHGRLLQGLHPVVQMRERPRGGGTEFRLIAGPLPNAASAARICAAMTAAGAICQPSVFEGQRLALH
jgi:hypothetical protein